MNAGPQQIAEASKEVEKFIKGIARSKKERKPVRPHVLEVRSDLRCDWGSRHRHFDRAASQEMV